MGGGFGAKFGAGSYGVLAAHLSKKAGAPVRLMLDRKEEHLCVGNRPATDADAQARRQEGRLRSPPSRRESHGNGGIATGGGVGWIGTTLYACDNTRIEQYDVFTNGGPAAAFRAPGQPMGAFALEQLDRRAGREAGAWIRSRCATSSTRARARRDPAATTPRPARARKAERQHRRRALRLGTSGASPASDAGAGQARHGHGAVDVGALRRSRLGVRGAPAQGRLDRVPLVGAGHRHRHAHGGGHGRRRGARRQARRRDR